jgi:hypothetical protein
MRDPHMQPQAETKESGGGRPERLFAAVAHAAVAALALVLADAAIRVLPFRVIARWLAMPVRRSRADTAGRHAAAVRWAVNAAQRRLRYVPCLAAAVAANRLLTLRGVPSEIFIGVRTDRAEPFGAHAWLLADGLVITGAEEKAAYEPLYSIATTV